MISVIIPVYNVQNSICKTLTSLLSQSDTNFEIIVINDGSTDNTMDVIYSLLSNSTFSNYKIINKKNGGVSSARNKGVLEATGDYIFFLDGDDYISSEMIKSVKNHISNKDIDILAWAYNVVNEDGTTKSDYFDLYSSESTFLTGLEALKRITTIPRSLWIWTCSAVYRKKFITENHLKYSEGCKNGEDQEFTIKALSEAKEIYFLDETLSYYVQREGSITNSYNIRKFDIIRAIERICDYLKMGKISESNEIINYFELDHIIENYFYNFDSCIEYLILDRKMSSEQSYNYLMSDINEFYPGLNYSIEIKIKSIRNMDFKSKIKYKLFVINPVLYIKIMKLKSYKK